MIHREGRSGLALELYGTPGQPVLVLLHGLHDSASCWPDAVARWGVDWRIVAIDARGHGRSPRFTAQQLADHPTDAMVADAVNVLAAVTDAAGLPAVAVGHSLGGLVLGAAAVRRPDLLRAVVLEDPAWALEDLSDEARQEAAANRVTWVQSFTDDLAAAVAAGREEHPTWPEVEYPPWAESKTHNDPAYLATADLGLSEDWRTIVTGLTLPTLLITGDRDVVVDQRRLDDPLIVDHPHLEVAVVPGAGHCVRRDDPTGYHAIVDPFLARHRVTSP